MRGKDEQRENGTVADTAVFQTKRPTRSLGRAMEVEHEVLPASALGSSVSCVASRIHRCLALLQPDRRPRDFPDPSSSLVTPQKWDVLEFHLPAKMDV